MPTYLYECPMCNRKFEIVRSMKSNDLSVTKCECGTDAKLVYTPFFWRISGLPRDRFKD